MGGQISKALAGRVGPAATSSATSNTIKPSISGQISEASAAPAIRLSPTPRSFPVNTSAAKVCTPAAAYEEMFMSPELLQKMQELGPLEKSTYTKQPTSPLSSSDARLLSAIEVRYQRTVTADAAEDEREMPQMRKAVHSSDQEEEWRQERAEVGRLSEIQAIDFFNQRRDNAASAQDLASMFSLDVADTETLLQSVSAPYFNYDKRAGIERGTREPRAFSQHQQ